MRVLVVNSRRTEADLLTSGLRRYGFDTASVGSGAQALRSHRTADLVLLDMDLSDMDGVKVCRGIRAESSVPIISFIDGGDELDRVLGLQAGSDDCLDKPFGFRELTARIDAVTRRSACRCSGREPVINHGALWINADTREVLLGERRVVMTRKEFDLLYCLASQPGVVVPRKKLMAEIWNDQVSVSLGTQASRTLDTHVSMVRNKLGAKGWIQTVRGVGFRFTYAASGDPAHASSEPAHSSPEPARTPEDAAATHVSPFGVGGQPGVRRLRTATGA